MNNMKKFSGFTLAEILVTIGLLGSIAAVTIPTLAYNYRGKVLEQQFRSTYSDIKAVASVLNEAHGGDWAAYVNGAGEHKWYAEFMSKFNGGGPYRGTSSYVNSQMTKDLRELYNATKNSGSGRYNFNIEHGVTDFGEICDDGGIWTDSKGRIWTFNRQNGLMCVDINGTAKPNRVNVDIFAFIPMSPEHLATYVYSGNPSDYTSTIVPCNLAMITLDASNMIPSREKGTMRKGSGSALDYCPFFQPLENIAVLKDDYCNDANKGCGKSARGKAMDASKNYWTNYIDYK